MNIVHSNLVKNQIEISGDSFQELFLAIYLIHRSIPSLNSYRSRLFHKNPGVSLQVVLTVPLQRTNKIGTSRKTLLRIICHGLAGYPVQVFMQVLIEL